MLSVVLRGKVEKKSISNIRLGVLIVGELARLNDTPSGYTSWAMNLTLHFGLLMFIRN